jgi:NitT/TauT family transport system permease protein
LLVIALTLLAWELLPRLGLAPPVLLAPVSQTVAAGFREAGVFADALAVTFGEIGMALVIAYGGGGIIGLLLGTVRALRLTLLPLVSSIYAIPFIVIYPVLTAWFGIGPESKILFAGLYGLFPMVLATAAGVQTVDRGLILAARSMGATRPQILSQIVVPASIPAILSGLRLGGALVAIGVVVAEMLASTAGIGFLITQNRTMFRTPEVYLGIFLVLVIAGTLDSAIGYVERRTAVWQPRKAATL